MQRGEALQGRLQRHGFSPCQTLHRDTIGLSLDLKRSQTSQLRLIGGHHQLAAGLGLHAMCGTERIQQLPTAHAQTRLQRAGRVVQPGMDDFTVA